MNGIHFSYVNSHVFISSLRRIWRCSLLFSINYNVTNVTNVTFYLLFLSTLFPSSPLTSPPRSPSFEIPIIILLLARRWSGLTRSLGSTSDSVTLTSAFWSRCWRIPSPPWRRLAVRRAAAPPSPDASLPTDNGTTAFRYVHPNKIFGGFRYQDNEDKDDNNKQSWQW